MTHPFLIFSQSDYLIQIVDMANSADLDLHSLQRQDISGFSRTRVKILYDLEVVIATVLALTVKIRKSQDFLSPISGNPGDQIFSLFQKFNLNILKLSFME